MWSSKASRKTRLCSRRRLRRRTKRNTRSATSCFGGLYCLSSLKTTSKITNGRRDDNLGALLHARQNRGRRRRQFGVVVCEVTNKYVGVDGAHGLMSARTRCCVYFRLRTCRFM